MNPPATPAPSPGTRKLNDLEVVVCTHPPNDKGKVVGRAGGCAQALDRVLHKLGQACGVE